MRIINTLLIIMVVLLSCAGQIEEKLTENDVENEKVNFVLPEDWKKIEVEDSAIVYAAKEACDSAELFYDNIVVSECQLDSII